MREKIFEGIRSIETKEGVKILLAVESGSRAWGFPSPDSDYDVRFIYLRKPTDYLKLNKVREVLEYPICNALDINGWDYFKALRLLHSSNPTLYEWFASPIAYAQHPTFKADMQPLLTRYFSKWQIMNHYLSMAYNNAEGFITSPEIKLKKYLYVLRALLSAKWVAEKGSSAPILFTELLDSELDPEYRDIVDSLLNQEMNVSELNLIKKEEKLNSYTYKLYNKLKANLNETKGKPDPGWEPLNQQFLFALENYWQE